MFRVLGFLDENDLDTLILRCIDHIQKVATSFNVRGEPIVCTPEDAFHCFMGTEIETLVVGNCFLSKADQDPALKVDYKDTFELD
jgi:hypothetical protein